MLVIALIFAGSCGPRFSGDTYDLNVAALNVEGGGDPHLGEAGLDTYNRYWHISNYFKSAEPFQSLVGLTELRYARDWTAGGYVLLDSLPFTCSSGDEISQARNQVIDDIRRLEPWLHGAECFGSLIRSTAAYTHRALGYNALYPFELVPGSIRYAHIGEPEFTLIYRTVVGARFRATNLDGLVIPFYVTHLSARKDSPETQELIDLMHEWYVAGDMPPVVVGDFNCHAWSTPTQQRMLNEFSDVTGGINEVMRILISRPQHYPSATRRWTPPQKGDGRKYDLGGKQYTDHEGVASTLHVDLRGTLPASWTPPSATQGFYIPGPDLAGVNESVGCPTTRQ